MILSCFSARKYFDWQWWITNCLIFKPIYKTFTKSEAEFNRSCLKQDKATFTHRKVGNLFIGYELDTCSRDLSTKFTLGDCIFRSVKLNNNAVHDKFRYSGYGIRFDAFSIFSINEEWGKMLMFLVRTNFYHCVMIVEKKIS